MCRLRSFILVDDDDGEGLSACSFQLVQLRLGISTLFHPEGTRSPRTGKPGDLDLLDLSLACNVDAFFFVLSNASTFSSFFPLKL
jgi:hypothetical protein